MQKSDCIDLEAIEALAILGKASEGSTFLEEIVSTYIVSSPQLLDQMKAAVASGSLEALRSCAHSLKSSSALVGAKSLSESCRKLEALQVLDVEANEQVSVATKQFDDVILRLKEILAA